MAYSASARGCSNASRPESPTAIRTGMIIQQTGSASVAAQIGGASRGAYRRRRIRLVLVFPPVSQVTTARDLEGSG